MDKNLFKSRIRLRHLDCFVRVAGAGHLGRAAAQLQLTQPAVSKTLSELEEIVGLSLLERSRAGTVLTPDGKMFLLHAQAVLDALDAAQASVASGRSPQPAVLHVGALPTVAPDLLPPVLAVFRREHPDTRIEVQTGTNAALIAMLRAGEISLALTRMAEPEAMFGLSFELLYVEPIVLAASPAHPLAGREASLQEVAGCAVVVSPKGTIPRYSTESAFHSHGLKLPAARVETLSVSLARGLAARAGYIWFVPAGVVQEDVDAGLLALLHVPASGLDEAVGLLQRGEAPVGPAAHALIAAIRHEAARRRKRPARRTG